jgi:hypothetical protein
MQVLTVFGVVEPQLGTEGHGGLDTLCGLGVSRGSGERPGLSARELALLLGGEAVVLRATTCAAFTSVGCHGERVMNEVGGVVEEVERWRKTSEKSGLLWREDGGRSLMLSCSLAEDADRVRNKPPDLRAGPRAKSQEQEQMPPPAKSGTRPGGNNACAEGRRAEGQGGNTCNTSNDSNSELGVQRHPSLSGRRRRKQRTAIRLTLGRTRPRTGAGGKSRSSEMEAMSQCNFDERALVTTWEQEVLVASEPNTMAASPCLAVNNTNTVSQMEDDVHSPA